MWQLHQTAKSYGQRPSDLVEISDRWAALQFDNAVALVGVVVENASQEQHNTGTDKAPKWELKYTMTELLDPEFRLPRPARKAKAKGIDGLKAMAGVRVLKG